MSSGRLKGSACCTEAYDPSLACISVHEHARLDSVAYQGRSMRNASPRALRVSLHRAARFCVKVLSHTLRSVHVTEFAYVTVTVILVSSA